MEANEGCFDFFKNEEITEIWRCKIIVNVVLDVYCNMYIALKSVMVCICLESRKERQYSISHFDRRGNVS